MMTNLCQEVVGACISAVYWQFQSWRTHMRCLLFQQNSSGENRVDGLYMF